LQLPRSISPLELKINSATVEKSPSQRTRPASRPKKREIPNFIKRTAITFLGSRDAISACVRAGLMSAPKAEPTKTKAV